MFLEGWDVYDSTEVLRDCRQLRATRIAGTGLDLAHRCPNRKLGEVRISQAPMASGFCQSVCRELPTCPKISGEPVGSSRNIWVGGVLITNHLDRSTRTVRRA